MGLFLGGVGRGIAEGLLLMPMGKRPLRSDGSSPIMIMLTETIISMGQDR